MPNYKRTGIIPPTVDLRGRIARIYTNSNGDLVFEYATGGTVVIEGGGGTPSSNSLDGGSATATNINDIDGGNAIANNFNNYDGGGSNAIVIFPP